MMQYGVAPYCHLSDGSANVFVVSHGYGRRNLLSQLFATAFGCYNKIYDGKSKIVKVSALKSVCEFRVAVKSRRTIPTLEGGMSGSISWNVDGEIIAASILRAVVHSRLLLFFGTGGPLPLPNFFSYLFFARFLKCIAPNFVLNPPLLKKQSFYNQFIDIYSWNRCKTSSTKQLLSVIFAFGILLLFLFFFNATSDKYYGFYNENISTQGSVVVA